MGTLGLWPDSWGTCMNELDALNVAGGCSYRGSTAVASQLKPFDLSQDSSAALFMNRYVAQVLTGVKCDVG